LLYTASQQCNKTGIFCNNPVAPASNFPELIITGIPRSGTSLLCRLLNNQTETVIINEPSRIFGLINQANNPEWLARYYRALRQKIWDGDAIENKVIDGEIIEDTHIIDQRSHYHPEVSRSDFILGTKNTLLYQSRLGLIHRSMPTATIVACIRNPIDTIASWQNSFPHLNTIDLKAFPGNYCNHPFLTGREKQRLENIQNCNQLPLKRALLWQHISETLLDHADSLCLLRYEDLIAEPADCIRQILTNTDPQRSESVKLNETLKPRSKRHLLSEADIHAIQDICGENARLFGYTL